MSTYATVSFASPISIDVWMEFAFARDIRFSPNTIGQNTFYGGGAEISLEGKGSVEEGPDGRIDWSSARPPMSFQSISLKVLHGADIEVFVETVNAVYSELAGVAVTRNVELDSFLVGLPVVHPIDKHDDLLPTDMVEGWAFVDGGYEATVQSGNARIGRDGDLWNLHIDGILRAKSRELNDGFAFAGRCDWNWWHGERPERRLARAALTGR
ncbi:hypothetical protein OIU34_17390 [Pararhizobium sp. BT-229]|uniref:hypothetical protein n=1 Tax=Pararhizobium sp. BT-229 TaxID=2986923 RepID=UPI0021F704D7|nr:hypothetical protein [Pararhizobium sp. BT-229]MCV9963677.1 hypothetical protein [Pararhizobium sp. BT-229]